jgi:hypothetical protein
MFWRVPDSNLSRVYPHDGKPLLAHFGRGLHCGALLPDFRKFAIIVGFPESVQGDLILNIARTPS